MKRLSCAVISFLISSTSIAQVPFPFSEQGWNSAEKKIIDKNYLNLLGVTVGTSTLDEVIEVFGQSEIYRSSNKNYSPNLLCYKSEHDNTGVIFQSGPLGGWVIVTAIWIGSMNFVDATRCVKSKLVDRSKLVINGLSLDLEASDVQNIIGKPTYKGSSFLAYRYEDNSETFDISSGFEFDFNQYQLGWFRIYRQLSN